jgi:hypothetical protein
VACRVRASGRSGSRAASNQQFTQQSRVCNGARRQRVEAVEAAVGIERRRPRASLRGRLAATCNGFRTAQGAARDWPDCGGEIKMGARQPVAGQAQRARQHARLARVLHNNQIHPLAVSIPVPVPVAITIPLITPLATRISSPKDVLVATHAVGPSSCSSAPSSGMWRLLANPALPIMQPYPHPPAQNMTITYARQREKTSPLVSVSA